MWFLWFEWLYKLNSLGKVGAKISWVVITIILLKFLITAKLVINSHKYLNWQIFDKNHVYLLLSWTEILWYKFHRDFYAYFAIFDVRSWILCLTGYNTSPECGLQSRVQLSYCIRKIWALVNEFWRWALNQRNMKMTMVD